MPLFKRRTPRYCWLLPKDPWIFQFSQCDWSLENKVKDGFFVCLFLFLAFILVPSKQCLLNATALTSFRKHWKVSFHSSLWACFICILSYCIFQPKKSIPQIDQQSHYSPMCNWFFALSKDYEVNYSSLERVSILKGHRLKRQLHRSLPRAICSTIKGWGLHIMDVQWSFSVNVNFQSP